MIPAARIQSAIEIVDLWQSSPEGLDRVLAAWGRANRYAGSSDRRAIADLVYDTVRRLRSAGWVAGAADSPGGRDLVLGSLILDGLDETSLSALFTGARHTPAALGEIEFGRFGQCLEDAPRPIRLDLPDWLAPHFETIPDAALELTRERAPIFLRVNLLRSDPMAAIAALAAEQIIAEPGPLSPTCLKILSGANAVVRSRAYLHGLVELQDAASQAVADYARAKPGEIVLDYCAGAGGKALVFAAAMAGQGRLYAHDIAPQRLAPLTARADRAGAEITLLEPGQVDSLTNQCDLVFVDAPCSGSGAWRRNPDAKWRFTEDQLVTYVQTQEIVLGQAAAMVRPGGRLIYATCSMLTIENQQQVTNFLASHSDFHPGRDPLVLTPADGGDGFFAAELLRKPE